MAEKHHPVSSKTARVRQRQPGISREHVYVTYRTKVRFAEAFRWTGQPHTEWPEWATLEFLAQSGSALYAYTKNGPVRVNRGDWVIQGDKEVYPCTDEEFKKRYEEIPQGDFKIENLRYADSERASQSGASLSGDLDAPPTFSPNHE
jgi:hypothetical protein